MNPLRPLALALAAAALPLSLAAATISGTVTDRTTNKPAAGDTAVLLDLTQGMQESARTTVDKSGHYSFTVPDAGGMHLVKIEHEKASYYGSVPPNTSTVDIDVYDVSPKVDGVHIYADVSRIETNQQGLSVTESWFIRNESKPPRTQFGPQAFTFFLPEGAVLEGSTATGPGGMAVSDAPVPLGDKDHYAFLFPVRPGETRFQVGYHIPYSGSLALHARVTMPADNVAVMLPKSMSFSGASFQPLPADANEPGVNTWLATNIAPNKQVDFSVSGSGSMPREQQGQTENAQGGPGMGTATDQPGGAAGQAPDQTARPGGGLGNPNGTPDPLNKYKGWILSGLGLALVIGAALMLRSKPGAQTAAAAPQAPAAQSALTPTLPATASRPAAAATNASARPVGLSAGHPPALDPALAEVLRAPALAPTAENGAGPRSALLNVLKEELFLIETERLEGKLTGMQYAELKSAFEVVLRRALEREALATR
ncbi:MAG: carboxypeptidase regulatory-like domain-containing protein [Acidobacteriaceae bacterium]